MMMEKSEPLMLISCLAQTLIDKSLFKINTLTAGVLAQGSEGEVWGGGIQWLKGDVWWLSIWWWQPLLKGLLHWHLHLSQEKLPKWLFCPVLIALWLYIQATHMRVYGAVWPTQHMHDTPLLSFFANISYVTQIREAILSGYFWVCREFLFSTHKCLISEQSITSAAGTAWESLISPPGVCIYSYKWGNCAQQELPGTMFGKVWSSHLESSFSNQPQISNCESGRELNTWFHAGPLFVASLVSSCPRVPMSQCSTTADDSWAFPGLAGRWWLEWIIQWKMRIWLRRQSAMARDEYPSIEIMK